MCGGDVFEIGGLGCCGAEVASCEGSIDGAPIDLDVFTDEEIDARAVYHYWYFDNGAPAPSETPSDPIPCRCEQTA